MSKGADRRTDPALARVLATQELVRRHGQEYAALVAAAVERSSTGESSKEVARRLEGISAGQPRRGSEVA